MQRPENPTAMTAPAHPVAAVVHPDPYPYYADLVARAPLHRDETLGLWVAASADAVSTVLTNELCRVRPPAEPVPAVLLGSPAAEVFRRLIRMNDGTGHCPFKRAVSAALDSVDAERTAAEADKWAAALFAEMKPHTDPARIMELAFRLPIYTMGSLLGIAAAELPQVAAWMGEFVRCIFSAGASSEQIERGKIAAAPLLALVRARAARDDLPPTSLLARLKHEASRLGHSDLDVVAANGLGFLSQAYEATAGLIGNTLVTLARNTDVAANVTAGTVRLHDVIDEVLRYDPPTHNTRRFLAADGIVAGQAMKAGDAILLVVAAANRDPAANPEPQRFDANRRNRRLFTFGAAAHACPGQTQARAIAHAGVARLLAADVALAPLLNNITYRPSGAARIPLFASTGSYGSAR